MSRIYEIMYLIDNEAVRAGWKEAKATVTALMEKHQGKVLSARRWEERKLAYPIRRRLRGTYLLAYGEFGPAEMAAFRRELDLSETVMRYLILSAESVPAQELELTKLEASSDFVVPMPPPEDIQDAAEVAVEEEESEESEESEATAELAEEEA